MKTHKMKKGSIIIGVAIAVLAMFTMVHEADAQRNSTNISVKDGRYTFSTKRGSNRLDVEYDGRVEFGEDDKTIKSISRGGYFRVRSTSFGNRREILAEADSDGTINYEYYEGRRRADFDEDGKKWLADILPDVIRTTGIGAEERTERFYKKGGVDGVLEEVDAIRSDYVSHIYLQVLLSMENLKDDDLVKIARYVPRELDSDHYITEVFKDYGDLFLKNEKTTEAFLSAIGRMDSDHYVSIILKRTLKEDLSDAMVGKVLDAAGGMSDHYKSSIMTDLINRRDIDESKVKQVIDYTDDMSDHYKSGILNKMLKNDQISSKYFNDVLRSADDMSDHYRNGILNYLLDNEDLGSQHFDLILEMVEDMSDHYSSSTLNKLMKKQTLKTTDYDKVLKSISGLSDHYTTGIVKSMLSREQLTGQHMDEIIELTRSMSDHYKSAIIKEVMSSKNELKDTNYQRILEVSDDLSDHYKVNLLKEMMKTKPTKATLLKVLEGIEDVDSDYYRSNLLVELCDEVGEDAELEKAFRKAMNTIKSDTYYGKVSRCLR